MSSALRQRYENALQNPYVKAFLYMIAMSEGTQQRHGYATMVGGGKIASLAKHPGKVIRLSKTLASSAAGRYQFLSRTWAACVRALGLTDFSPHSQDLAAVHLIAGRGGLEPLLKGDVKTAINKCRKEWASLPGAGYGQNEHKLEKQLAWYNSYLKGAGMVASDLVSNVSKSVGSLGSDWGISGFMALGVMIVIGVGLVIATQK